ncbi:hypothetical protein [Arthrobacter sp. CJ23]|uniref:hypothetical protein n=1 Tax=Arthrobacter sp. CJ23 TaxID=2972479 RepID=UPI00215CF864|nr:hypothetical protein [Arthrobacter sp. CJ23]UVJ40043.1 hypothetical protein NVV90_02275 [Arthrobacter sp. CJ23]
MTTTSINTTAPTATKSAQNRIQLTKSRIIAYLADHGASKVSDITDGVPACKDTVKVRLAELEEDGTIRANVPAGERGRTTPYYSLTTAGIPPKEPKTVITVHIQHASDGRLTLAFDDYPELTATARSFIDIPAASRQVAARHTGRPEDSFTVHIRF